LADSSEGVSNNWAVFRAEAPPAATQQASEGVSTNNWAVFRAEPPKTKTGRDLDVAFEDAAEKLQKKFGAAAVSSGRGRIYPTSTPTSFRHIETQRQEGALRRLALNLRPTRLSGTGFVVPTAAPGSADNAIRTEAGRPVVDPIPPEMQIGGLTYGTRLFDLGEKSWEEQLEGLDEAEANAAEAIRRSRERCSWSTIELSEPIESPWLPQSPLQRRRAESVETGTKRPPMKGTAVPTRGSSVAALAVSGVSTKRDCSLNRNAHAFDLRYKQFLQQAGLQARGDPSPMASRRVSSRGAPMASPRGSLPALSAQAVTSRAGLGASQLPELRSTRSVAALGASQHSPERRNSRSLAALGNSPLRPNPSTSRKMLSASAA